LASRYSHPLSLIYLPGDEFVDWIGVSIFQQVFPWSPYWGGKMEDVERVLNFAHEHDKV